MNDKIKIDLGGGQYPYKGFLNLDSSNINFVNLEKFEPDIKCDLNEGIPFGNNEVDEVFTSHFLEHALDPKFLLNEIVRVCKDKATVTIIIPLHDMSNKTHITEFDSKWFINNPIKGLQVLEQKVKKKDLVDPLFGDRIIEEMYIKAMVNK